MAERTRGMGRGLASILASGSGAAALDTGDLRELPVESITPNPHQPRTAMDQEGLDALADSLRERGVLQPILVRPLVDGRYELIAGERRWRAAQIAGRPTVPALVRQHDDAESLELALIENMAREDLNPIDQARACQALVDELGLTREEIGRRVGRSRVAVSNLMRLLDLPDDVLELLEQGTLTEGHGRALLVAHDHDDRRTLARLAVAEGWTVRRVEQEARATAADVEPSVRRTPATPPVSADQRDAAERLSDGFARAFGTDVKVRPRGDGFAVSITLDSWDDALALAERLGAVELA